LNGGRKRKRKAMKATERMRRTMEVVNYADENCSSIVHSFKNEQIYRENIDCENGRERGYVCMREREREREKE